MRADEEFWDAVYDVLVNECGAYEGERGRFIHSQVHDKDTTQWRFGGSMGYGGKLINQDSCVGVSYYREDENPKRLAAMEKADSMLADLVAEYTKKAEAAPASDE